MLRLTSAPREDMVQQQHEDQQWRQCRGTRPTVETAPAVTGRGWMSRALRLARCMGRDGPLDLVILWLARVDRCWIGKGRWRWIGCTQQSVLPTSEDLIPTSTTIRSQTHSSTRTHYGTQSIKKPKHLSSSARMGGRLWMSPAHYSFFHNPPPAPLVFSPAARQHSSTRIQLAPPFSLLPHQAALHPVSSAPVPSRSTCFIHVHHQRLPCSELLHPRFHGWRE